MFKTVLTAGIVLSLVCALGCSELSDFMQESSSSGPDIVRRAELGENWQMDQMRVHMDAEAESLMLLRLPEGGKVDGYFYMEKGNEVEFQITGKSLIYKFEAADNEDSAGNTSDRLSFIADQTQGDTYTFTFRNPTEENETAFLEVIYPINGSLFVPIAEK